MIEVFLGGTTAEGTNWRELLIPELDIEYFNPVVDDWNEEAYQKELEKRETCDFVLYVISPLMEGVYSIAEVVDDSNKRPEKTILCILDSDGEGDYAEKTWSKHQKKSLVAVQKLVEKNGAVAFNTLEEIADFLNEFEYSDSEREI